ncbi:hypothetical protein ABET36_07680 [Caldifermentibacillus hisashii]
MDAFSAWLREQTSRVLQSSLMAKS